MDITVTKKELSKAKRNLNQELGRFPLDIKKIFELEDEVESYECGLVRLERFKKERF